MVAVPLAAAVAESVIAPETVLPLAGLTKVTVGGGATLPTVTVMLALLVLPRLSWATAVSVWLPLVNVVVLSWIEYGAAATVPRLFPSTLNCTLAIVAAPLAAAVAEIVIG